MDETYEQMRERIAPERYELARWIGGTLSTTDKGVDGELETRSEPLVFVTVRDRASGNAVASGVALNTLFCDIPEGPSGLFPRGMDATDEEIILALIEDQRPAGWSLQRRETKNASPKRSPTP